MSLQVPEKIAVARRQGFQVSLDGLLGDSPPSAILQKRVQLLGRQFVGQPIHAHERSVRAKRAKTTARSS